MQRVALQRRLRTTGRFAAILHSLSVQVRYRKFDEWDRSGVVSPRLHVYGIANAAMLRIPLHVSVYTPDEFRPALRFILRAFKLLAGS